MGSGIRPIGVDGAAVDIPFDTERYPLVSAPIPALGASATWQTLTGGEQLDDRTAVALMVHLAGTVGGG